MEKLKERWRNLSLSKAQRNEIQFDEKEMIEELNRGALYLVGKIHSERVIRKMVIQSTMNKIWKLSQPCAFQDISSNLFILQFAFLEDKNWVLKGIP